MRRVGWWLQMWALVSCGATIPTIGDVDGDGFRADVDCDDQNPDVHPGASDDLVDGVDGDCDGLDRVRGGLEDFAGVVRRSIDLSAAVCDFNGDGQDDLATSAISDDGVVEVSIRPGPITDPHQLPPRTSVLTSDLELAVELSCGDWDGNGTFDLVSPNVWGDELGVFLNPGGFAPMRREMDVVVDRKGGWSRVQLADLDGDGMDEVSSCGDGIQSLLIDVGDGRGEGQGVERSIPGVDGCRGFVTDVVGDGLPNLIVSTDDDELDVFDGQVITTEGAPSESRVARLPNTQWVDGGRFRGEPARFRLFEDGRLRVLPLGGEPSEALVVLDERVSMMRTLGDWDGDGSSEILIVTRQPARTDSVRYETRLLVLSSGRAQAESFDASVVYDLATSTAIPEVSIGDLDGDGISDGLLHLIHIDSNEGHSWVYLLSGG